MNSFGMFIGKSAEDVGFYYKYVIFFQNNNIHSSPTPWVKQPGSASTAESPILAPRRRLESVESAAKFLTEALPNNNMTGYCKKTFSLDSAKLFCQ